MLRVLNGVCAAVDVLLAFHSATAGQWDLLALYTLCFVWAGGYALR